MQTWCYWKPGAREYGLQAGSHLDTTSLLPVRSPLKGRIQKRSACHPGRGWRCSSAQPTHQKHTILLGFWNTPGPFILKLYVVFMGKVTHICCLLHLVHLSVSSPQSTSIGLCSSSNLPYLKHLVHSTLMMNQAVKTPDPACSHFSPQLPLSFLDF